MITYGPTTQGDFAVADSGIVTGRYKAESLAYQAASELASPDVPRRTHFQISPRPAPVEMLSVFHTPPPPPMPEEPPASKPARKKAQR